MERTKILNKELPINTVVCGDALGVLRTFPDESIDCCLTSPPYWGFRDYGVEQIFGGDPTCRHKWGAAAGATAQVGNQKKKIQGTHINQGKYCQKCNAWKGQLGLEPTPELYIEHLIEILSEVKRVLKKEGTLWINMGDTYGGSCQGGGDTGLSKERYRKELLTYVDKPQKKMMPKCLMMIPERLAWSLIQDGWILRNKIIWHKRNHMPSSAKDRFTNSWEYIFLFSKNKKYYFDLDAVREPYTKPLNRWGGGTVKVPKKTKWKSDDEKAKWAMSMGERKSRPNPLGKNPEDVWDINTESFPEAHFAVFPEKLCEKPIKAGCPEQICKKCGKATWRVTEGNSPYAFNMRVRDVKKNRIKHIDRVAPKNEVDQYKEGVTHTGEGRYTVGWTSCNCGVGFEGGTVLDPFCGAGTTGVVAKKLDRKFIGIDISEKFCEMARKRISQAQCQLKLKINP